MKSAREFVEIFLYRHPCDMRKQIRGLTQITGAQFSSKIFDDCKLFVFCNRRRQLLKCIYWDRSGFAMWVKQLDEEKFPWPRKLSDDVVKVTPEEFEWLLSGIDLWKMKRHKTLAYDRLY